MKLTIGKLTLEAERSADGCHVDATWERSPHPEWRHRRWLCLFNVCYVRRCDTSVTLMGRTFWRKLG